MPLPSTKNEEKARDPEMRQTKKGKDWHFGMKAHIGTEQRGVVHSLSTTVANVHDSTLMSKLLHGDEREVFGDQAYWNESHRQSALAAGHSLPYQSAPTAWQTIEQVSEVHQPSPLCCSSPSRACVPCSQAPVGFWQSSLPRLGEEYSAAVYRLRAGEPVSAETPLAATAVDVCLMIAMQCKSSEKHRIKALIYPLPRILL